MATPYPKPQKGSCKKHAASVKLALKEHRKEQYKLAIERDRGLCVICKRKHGCTRKADDVHHVFGRGRSASDWRECYRSLMCVCRECHPQPIRIKGASKNLEWVEELLDNANNKPENKNFRGTCEHREHENNNLCRTDRPTAQLQACV